MVPFEILPGSPHGLTENHCFSHEFLLFSSQWNAGLLPWTFKFFSPPHSSNFSMPPRASLLICTLLFECSLYTLCALRGMFPAHSMHTQRQVYGQVQRNRKLVQLTPGAGERGVRGKYWDPKLNFSLVFLIPPKSWECWFIYVPQMIRTNIYFDCYTHSTSVLSTCQLGALGKLLVCELQFSPMYLVEHSIDGIIRQIMHVEQA